MEERAKQIAQDIKNNTRLIILKLDKSNSTEPFMSFTTQSDIDMDIVQGEILKRVSILEYKLWCKNSEHSYNNKIRKMVAKLL